MQQRSHPRLQADYLGTSTAIIHEVKEKMKASANIVYEKTSLNIEAHNLAKAANKRREIICIYFFEG